MCQRRFETSRDGAVALLERGANRVLVTNGGKATAKATRDGIIEATPPEVLVTRITGAGDTFMAGHIAAELAGDGPDLALSHALQAAAAYVSGETNL